MKKLFLALGAFVSVFLFAGSVATAQYPPPTGSMTLTADATNAAPGDSVELTCTVRDTAGNPIEGAECTLTIVSEPNDGASFGSGKSTVEVTNSDGVATATLYVGDDAGQVVVSGVSGAFSSAVIVSVGAAPPASEIAPPSTGDGGLAH